MKIRIVGLWDDAPASFEEAGIVNGAVFHARPGDVPGKPRFANSVILQDDAGNDLVPTDPYDSPFYRLLSREWELVEEPPTEEQSND